MLATIADFILSFGLIPTLLLAGYGPFLSGLICLVMQKNLLEIPRRIRVGFFVALTFSITLELLVLFVYSLTRSGI